MILVPASDLSEGMVIGREKRDRNNNLVIPRGATLNSNSLRLLQRMDSVVYIASEGEDITEKEAEYDANIVTISTAIEQALGSFQCHMETKNISVDPTDAELIACALREDITAKSKRVSALQEMLTWSERLFQHSFNTAILAAIITQKILRSQEQSRTIALAMMFHDYGQLHLPREVFEKQGKLTEEEKHIARKHPLVGYLYIKDNNLLSTEASEIVYQHHERLDGAGYPQGLTAEQIKPLSRIAAVVEAFDAMTSLRAYARAATPDEAMKIILGQIGKAYDREVALNLTRHIVLYPVGTAVRLNSGECGMVIATTPGNPTRPIVRLFFGSDGRRIAAAEVNLATDTTRMVVHSAGKIDEVRTGARV